MLGRFSRQLRELPENLNRRERVHQTQLSADTDGLPEIDANAANGQTPVEPHQRDEILSLARVILEREVGRPNTSDASRTALERLLEMVRSGELHMLDDGLAYQLSQVDDPSDELIKVGRLLKSLIGNEA